MTPPKLIVHEVRNKAHRLIVEDQKSPWVSLESFAYIRVDAGEGFAASPVLPAFLSIPRTFYYKSVYATEVSPTEVKPTDDEDLPTQ